LDRWRAPQATPPVAGRSAVGARAKKRAELMQLS